MLNSVNLLFNIYECYTKINYYYILKMNEAKSWKNVTNFFFFQLYIYFYLFAYLSTMQFPQSYSKHSFLRWFYSEGRRRPYAMVGHTKPCKQQREFCWWRLFLAVAHQFLVAVQSEYECLQQLPNTMPFYSLKRSLSPRSLFDALARVWG